MATSQGNVSARMTSFDRAPRQAVSAVWRLFAPYAIATDGTTVRSERLYELTTSRIIYMTMKNTYNPSLEELVTNARNTPFANARGYTLEFARFSTALYRCRTDIPLAQHGHVFQDACAYQSLAVAEDSCPWWQGRLTALALPQELLAKAGIIATFHTGSYRLLPRWLHMHGLPFSLVVSKTVNVVQGGRFRALAGNPHSHVFDIIDAEHPSALLSMRRALRAGRYLLVYIDGNTGALPLSAKHAAHIPFFDARIRVRTGLAHLAYLANVPIYPILQQRTHHGCRPFNLYETIRAPHPSKRDEFALNTTKQLYRLLERGIQSDPAQWENWFHLRPAEQKHEALSHPADPAWITAWSGKKVYRIDRKTGACIPLIGTPSP